MSDFSGFDRRTAAFLRGVQRNNDRGWFEAHRDDYERYWLGPAREFVEAVGPGLAKVIPGIEAVPKVNGSIFRINRDVRFSTDKRPYKENLDLWFWEGDRGTAASGFFFRLTPSQLGIGAGAHRLDRDRLQNYRRAVVGGASGPALERAITRVEGAGWSVEGEHYRRTSSGVEATGRTERLLRFNALWVGKDEPLPDVVFTPDAWTTASNGGAPRRRSISGW